MARTNEAGRKLIKKWEGIHLRAYQDPGGIWTIGVGHTGPEVKRGLATTKEKAEALFTADLRRFEKCVENGLKLPANLNQFSAMVSLCFNIGCTAFRRSTLLKRFNAGQTRQAGFEFERWIKQNGKVLPGLVKRRAEERRLYETVSNAG